MAMVSQNSPKDLQQRKRTMQTTAPLSPVHSNDSKKHRTKEMSPILYLRSILGSSGTVNSSPSIFLKPTDEMIDAYDLEAVRAIRAQDLQKLKSLHKDGKSMNACNQFGESLLHMACRRGNLGIVSFMLKESDARVEIRDDFGRNPLHDACWTSTPNFEMMDILIEFVDPFMLLAEDVRGSTPFEYVRRNHWSQWVEYLSQRKELLQEQFRRAQDSDSKRKGT